MEERDHGIILRVRPLTETSLIVQWLGREHGLISTVAKGARRPKSAFMGKLDLYYTAHFTFQRSRQSELHTLRELQLNCIHERLRHDLGWLNQAAYAGALIEHTSERETPVPAQYELLLDFLQQLPKTPPCSLTIFQFELRLLDLLGLTPGLENARLSAESKAIIGRFCDEPKTQMPISDLQMNEIARFLISFLGEMNQRLRSMRRAALIQSPQLPEQKVPGPMAMLGKARRFRPNDNRSTDEIMRDLRSGETI